MDSTSDLKARTLLVEDHILPYFLNGDFVGVTDYLSQQSEKINTRFTIINQNGRVLADSNFNSDTMDNHKNRPEVIQALAGKWGVETRYSDTLNVSMLYISKPITVNDQLIGVIRSSIPINALDQTLNDLIQKMVIWGCIICLFSAGIGYVVSRRIRAPINDLTDGADQFSEGNFDFKVAVPRITEFKKLALALNHMAAQLKDRMFTIIKTGNEKDAILSNMVEGIIAVDTNYKITIINQAAKQYFCDENDNVIGKYFQDVITNNELIGVVRSTLSSEDIVDVDITINDPQELILHGHCVCLRNSDNDITGALLVLHDVTRIEKIRDNAKKLCSKCVS